MPFSSEHKAISGKLPNAKLIATLLAATAFHVAVAQEIPPPVDKVYPGTIQLDVDVTNLDQKIFKVHERIPVTAGKLTLFYPQWLPGNHAPTGPISQLAGLMLTANGQPVEWKRDTLNMFAFHLTVPANVKFIDADYQFLSPVEGNQGRITATQEIVGVQWNAVVLYPAGYYARGISFKPSVTLPADWKFGTALELAQQVGTQAQFKQTNLDDLIDSPLFAGKYFKRFDLDPGAKVPVFLNVVADRPENLVTKPEQIDAHRALVQQAYKLYGSQHYVHYDFLLSLSDEFTGIGLEHHQSSENGVKPNYFTEWSKTWGTRGLLPHEFTHSWDGKFRRPADLWTPNFNVPMQNSLLWVYEGQTEYWGDVLAARSGLVSVEQTRDTLANIAASYDQRVGRTWRALQDTTNMPIISRRSPLAWVSWQRPEDYYREGQLVWLDVDTKIREMSGEQKSLNDFAHTFFGVENGRHSALTYTFDDVVSTLNAIQPYDWATFLRTRLDGHAKEGPKDGLTRAGWKLAYTEERSEATKSEEEERHVTDYAYSLGFTVGKEGRLDYVAWDGVAFKHGMTIGATLLAVNGRSYKAELLKEVITAAKTSKQPIELLLKKDDRYHTVSIDYHDGLKYPHLVRIEGTPDRLTTILQPLK
ncbi:M61 family metallopeptidase [Solimicrobium silvestre]|uniref:Putative protease with the C-terminal PDZ domain n=1 Tax=Solimicrobium silvestre TaxID=2099400 RepID=A0A2S9GU22_9BURK|nr:M61 family metallopeptidase [Solimicrobium silvestre]PRC91201.1 putative protease with the C-terminal PDZ domain [Solimicrobium silvestre]